MEEEARERLKQTVARVGRDLTADSRRCEALLRDAFGDRFRKEASVLMAAVREGVASELAAPRSTSSTEALLGRLSLRMQEHQGLETSAARWSVESWALALGAARPADLVFGAGCPVCHSSVEWPTWRAGKVADCPSCSARIAISVDRAQLMAVSDAGTPVVQAPSRASASPARVAKPAARPTPPAAPPAPLPAPAPAPAQGARSGVAASATVIFVAAVLVGAYLLFVPKHDREPPAAVAPSLPPRAVEPPAAQPAAPEPAPQATTSAVAPVAAPDSGASKVAVPADVFDPAPVVAANEASVLTVLRAARDGVPAEVDAAARAAARAFDFQPRMAVARRDRTTARRLNEQALATVGSEITRERARDALAVQQQAFAADPFDVEVASNLAMYLLRSGDTEGAYRFALYAMSLPRGPDNTGRTADWNTLAAVFATRDDQERARGALFATLALSSNITKRCDAAVQAVRRTYGPVLRPATEAMFERIRERALSEASECSLPIAW